MRFIYIYICMYVCYVYSEVPQARCHGKEKEFRLNLFLTAIFQVNGFF